MTLGLKKGDFAPPYRVFEVGGCEQRLKEARPVLETFASKILHMGASGNGQLAKALNNCQGLRRNNSCFTRFAFVVANIWQDMPQDKFGFWESTAQYPCHIITSSYIITLD